MHTSRGECVSATLSAFTRGIPRTNDSDLVPAHNVQPQSNFLRPFSLAKDALAAISQNDVCLVVKALQGALQAAACYRVSCGSGPR